MKLLYTATLAVLLNSCAATSTTSKLMEAAAPIPTDKPSSKPIDKSIKVADAITKIVIKEVSEAKDQVLELEKRVVEGEQINRDFGETIDILDTETSNLVVEFHDRYNYLHERYQDTVNTLKSNITDASSSLDNLNDELSTAKGLVIRLDNDLTNSDNEKVKLRQINKALTVNAEDVETHKEKASSLFKYKLLFWGTLAALLIALYLKYKVWILSKLNVIIR